MHRLYLMKGDFIMYFSLQIPMLDTRYFLEKYKTVYFDPSVLENRNRKQFYRRFGTMKPRMNDSTLSHYQKNYVESRKAVKFSQHLSKCHLINVTERMYANKQIIHFEIGLKTLHRQNMSYRKFLKYYQNMLCEKIFLKGNTPVSFLDVFPSIAEKYELATTYKKFTSQLTKINKDGKQQLKELHVLCGNPIIFVEYREGEIFNFPADMYSCEFNDMVHISFDSILVNDMSTYVWFIRKDSQSQRTISRQARIALSKIHHEQMGIENFLSWFARNLTNKNEINRDETLEFIGRLLKAIRRQSDKLERNEIYRKALQAYYDINEQELYDCTDMLEDTKSKLLKSRKQLKRRSR